MRANSNIRYCFKQGKQNYRWELKLLRRDGVAKLNAGDKHYNIVKSIEQSSE